MRKHNLLILIAVAIIFCLFNLSNAEADKSDLVKRKQDSPYKPYGGLYSNQNKHKKKKKHKNKSYKEKRHHLKAEIIKKREDTSGVPEPDLGEVSVREDDKALLLNERQLPNSTGHMDTNKIIPGVTSNP